MAEDKQEQLWQEIKRRAREDIRNGVMVVKLKIHSGQIMGAEISPQDIIIKLG